MPLYVSTNSDEDECNSFVLTRTHMKPRRNAENFMRCVSRKEVLAALKNPSQRWITCSDVPGAKITNDWDVTRNDDGSITVGCTTFPKKSVAKIRKWAEGVRL